jgi:TonB family protein
MADNHHDIERYLSGELSPAEMHALEKKALYDPFLAEALEGAAQLPPADLSADLQQLQASLRKVSQRTAPGVSLRVWSLRIAATLLLLAVSTAIIVRIVSTEDQRLALQSPPTPRRNETPTPTLPRADSGGISALPAEADTRKAAIPPAQTRDHASHASPNFSLRQDVTLEPAAEEVVSEVYVEQPPVVADVQEAAPAETEAKTQPTDGYAAVSRMKESSSTSRSDEKAKKNEAATMPTTLSGRVAGVAVAPAPVADKQEERVPAKMIKGKVTLSDDGTGIPGVNVMVVGSDQGTVTDVNGNYQIRVDDDANSALAFSFIGMQSKEIPLGGEDQIDVALDQDVSQLSEVVVTGFNTDIGPVKEDLATFQLAAPAGGRGAFKQYLETNLHYPEQALASEVEGKVTIQFTVESSGRLSEFKVLKGIGYGCDEEVIRLIKNGPKWQPSKRADEAVKDNVKVRLKFRLPKKK